MEFIPNSSPPIKVAAGNRLPVELLREVQARGGDIEDDEPQTDKQTDSISPTEIPWAYRLVRLAIIGVILAFLLIMLLYAWLDVFNEDNAANISAALSSLFGIVGTLVGAYFGIKATSESKTAVENVHKEAADRLANAAQSATDTAQAATERQIRQ